MLNGTSSVIGNSVSKAGDAIGDATSTVRDVASEKGSVLEGIARAAIRALPGVPERLFLSLLDRVGLSRKPARTDGLGAFALGFAAGGATAALLTPMSGPQMRKQIVGALKRLGAASEETASGTQTRVSEPESRETGDAASTSGAAERPNGASHAANAPTKDPNAASKDPNGTPKGGSHGDKAVDPRPRA